MAQNHVGNFPSAKLLRTTKSPFRAISTPELTPFMVASMVSMVLLMIGVLLVGVTNRKKTRAKALEGMSPRMERPKFTVTGNPQLVITGTSV